MLNPLTDDDITRLDAGPPPLGDHDVALHDVTQAARPQKPQDPRQVANQIYAAKRQKMDKMYQGLAKSNKIASYGVPAGTLTDQQQATYNAAAAKLAAEHQAATAGLPAGMPQAPPMMRMADGGIVKGDANVLQDAQGEAVGRFTRTPIHIQSTPNYLSRLNPKDKLNNGLDVGTTLEKWPTQSSGEYKFDRTLGGDHHIPANIVIDLGKGGTYQDANHVSAHEQIHALLSPTIDDNTPQPPDFQPRSLWDAIANTNPNTKAFNAWDSSNRAGRRLDELPAYMGAYQPGQLPGITAEDAARYQQNYMRGLPPDKAAIYQKLVNANNAALNMPAFAAGGLVRKGPMPAIVGEGTDANGFVPEVIQHSNGLPSELITGPQVRQLGVSGTDRIVPLKGETPAGYIRGSIDVPLSEQGRGEIREIAQALARSGGLDDLTSSGMARTGETAGIIAGAVGAPQPAVDPGLVSWSMGAMEGRPVSDATDQLEKQFINQQPDQAIPGAGPGSTRPGESFNSFRHRVLGTMQKHMARSAAAPHKRIGIVTHNRDIKMMSGWLKAGARPDHSIDTKTLEGAGDPPGSIHHLSQGANGAWQIKPFKPGKMPTKGGIYLIRHGHTAMNPTGREHGS